MAVLGSFALSSSEASLADIGHLTSLVGSRWTTFAGRALAIELSLEKLSLDVGASLPIAGGTFVGRPTVTGWLAATAAKGTSTS